MGGFLGGMATAIGEGIEKKRDREYEVDKELRQQYFKTIMDPNISDEARQKLADSYSKYLGPESKKGFQKILPTISKVVGLHRNQQQPQQAEQPHPGQAPASEPVGAGDEAGPQSAGERALPAPQAPQAPPGGRAALPSPVAMGTKQRQAAFSSALAGTYQGYGGQARRETQEQHQFETQKLDQQHKNKLEEIKATAEARGGKMVGSPFQMVDPETKKPMLYQRVQNSDGTSSLQELGEPPEKQVNSQAGWAKTPDGQIVAIRIDPRTGKRTSTDSGEPVPEETRTVNPSVESAEMRQWSYGRMGDLYRAAKGQGQSDDQAKKTASDQFRQKYLLDLSKEQQDIAIKEALSGIGGGAGGQTPGSRALSKPSDRSPVTGLTPNDQKDVNYYIGSVMGMQKGGGQAAAVRSQRGQEALQKATGLNSMELSAALTEDKALGKSLGATIERAGAFAGLQNTLKEHGQVLLDAAKAYDPTGSPLANRTVQWIEKNVEAHPELSKYQIAMQAVQREYGKLVSGATQSRAPLHVAAIKEGAETFRPDATMADVAASVEQLKTEADAEAKAFRETINDIKQRYGSGAIGNTLTPQSPGTRALPAPASGAKPGAAPKTADDYLKSIGVP
jgi:hypothetical protein